MVTYKRYTPKSWRNPWLIAGIVCVFAIGGWLLNENWSREESPQPPALNQASNPQTNGDKVQPSQLKDKSTAHQESVAAYISDFLRKGYGKYYAIQEIDHHFVSQQVKDGDFEAVVTTTMQSRPKNLASDPDTVPYIKEAREKAERETDPAVKKVDQKIYETMKQEYGRVGESNYTFKFTAHLDGETIDENSIKLYLVQDAEPNHSEYLPAEDLFQ
ncbi:MAG: hypothetical protein GXY34_14010 [Syntrophomonadaceae bacterium]|nr:hypothetical protein [Syntrophomonadaceae bacterium]